MRQQDEKLTSIRNFQFNEEKRLKSNIITSAVSYFYEDRRKWILGTRTKYVCCDAAKLVFAKD